MNPVTTIKPSSVGLCGAHRTGKTTLAREVSARLSVPFVQTTTSEIMRRHGVDPSLPMDFATRLSVQFRILEAYEELFAAQEREFVTDRTPVDLMAYTLADVAGATAVDHAELDRYAARCFDLTNKVFGTLFVVQPGIALVHAEGKAALNTSYIEHLNTLVLGLCHDERNLSQTVVLRRAVTDLDERARSIVRRWCWEFAGRGAAERQAAYAEG